MMIFQNPNYCMGNRSTFEKLMVALKILRNPWMLVLDKLGISKEPIYKSTTGMVFITRGGTTDINDAVVVLSGKEYPIELIGLDSSNKAIGSNSPVVLDCGGHIGSFTMFIKSHFPNARIFSMEPVPNNQELFNKNITLNNLQDVTMIPYALYGNSGTFYIDLANKQYDAVHVTTEKPTHDKFITINALTLDQVVQQNNIPVIDLMKLDVEGAEYHIFENSLESLRKHVRRIIMEFHPAGDVEKRNELVDRVCRNGDFELIYETKNILGFDNKNIE